MKNNLCILSALFITLPCTAMETDDIKELRSIVFLTNNTVAIGGKNGCAVFDSNSQQLIKKLTPSTIESLVANKDVIAILGRDETKKKFKPKLTVFDATTHTKKWSEIDYNSHLALGSEDYSLFTSSCATLKQYDYVQQETKNTGFSFHVEYLNSKPISCHPTQNIVLFSVGTGMGTTHPSRKQGNRERRCVELLALHNIGIHHSYHAISDCMFAPDGHTILFKHYMGRTYASHFIYNLTDEKEIAHYILDSQEYSAFAFHPTLMLLAALSHENRVKFWDYRAHTLIATTDQLSHNDHQKKEIKQFTQQLSFSPDGSQLAVALPDAWHIISPLSHIDSTNLVNIAPLPVVPTKIDISRETERKCVQKWVYFEDPDASEHSSEKYEL